MNVTQFQLDKAALALFTLQATDLDLTAAAAQLEWDADPDLRNFWRRQVAAVLGALGEAGVIEGYTLTLEGSIT